MNEPPRPRRPKTVRDLWRLIAAAAVAGVLVVVALFAAADLTFALPDRFVEANQGNARCAMDEGDRNWFRLFGTAAGIGLTLVAAMGAIALAPVLDPMPKNLRLVATVFPVATVVAIIVAVGPNWRALGIACAAWVGLAAFSQCPSTLCWVSAGVPRWRFVLANLLVVSLIGCGCFGIWIGTYCYG